MKKRTLSLSTFFGFLGLMLLIHAFNSNASVAPNIVCETAFGEKSFTIKDQNISFLKADEKGVQRSISSVSGDSVRTHLKYKGFTKTMYINGYKHRINIENFDSFSEVEDYLSITSPKGHEMTYPLTCHSV